MMFPGILWFVIYKYFPMYGAVIAFKEFDIMQGILQSSWADPWYKHFQFFFESPYFNQLLANTFLISIYKLIFNTFPPILLAVLLNECRKEWFKRTVQTIMYMPHFLSWVIIYGIVLAFLSQSSGLVNHWLTELGLKSVPFLTSTEWFRSILVGTEVWQSAGWGAIIYLAAMTGIDPSLYEAARVDGAGRMRMIWHITLPGIRSVIILLLILHLGKIMEAGFEQVYVFYNISVYEVGDIIDTWVFRTGLEQLNFSLSAAVGIFKSVIGLVLVVVSNRIARRWGEGIW
ncbi:ABC transporter permease [Paenibacillus thalictri]|uniref:Sugar ABC transporter permease n=1 Tax=Paenibacillus thalictri TaxID=2527873 RepID=A0A4Q9DZW6_9BACL|nr:ABC transporter permease subunit [Paenibacillus thalictri]TBL81393.1 sugar ABC transporter permease [Paenibacillus thalictri]